MKRTNIVKILSAIIFMAFCGVVIATISWFVPLVEIEASQNPIKGITEGAYFAYGNGLLVDENDPTTAGNRKYGISKPRHLYNLAWLQYLGFFNDENGTQYHFELANDIDMDGWTLPPIGTEENPFIGSFDGQGYVISNLTVSSDYADYDRHPSSVKSPNDNSSLKYNTPHIVGFIGVLGDYNGDYDESNGTLYSSTANEFVNTGLSDITIESNQSSTLVGLAAGYVDANIENVAIDNGTLHIEKANSTSYGSHTNNVSDFAVVGYTTKKENILKVTDSLYAVNVDTGHEFNATETGNDNGWGGSINMKNVFERIYNIQQRGTTSSFTYRTITTHQANGTTSSTTSTNNSVIYSSNNQIGNFHYRESNSNYNYMCGGSLQVDNYYSYKKYPGFYITDGTHYLSVSNGSKTVTNEESADYWAKTNDNKIYTFKNNTQYFLRNNNGSLAITTNTSQASTWSIDDSNTFRAILNNNYGIKYENSTFNLSRVTTTTTSPYSIRENRYSPSVYLSVNGTNPSYSTTEQKIWTLSTTSGQTTISTVINGTTYYIGRENKNSNYPHTTLTTTPTTFTISTSNNVSTITISSGTYKYLCYYDDSDRWYYSSNNNSGYKNMTITGTTTTTSTLNIVKSATVQNAVSGPDSEINDSLKTTKMNYTSTNTTYFPLNVSNDGGNSASSLTNGDYNPTDSNTGYVTIGSTISESDELLSTMRVSKYAKSNNSHNISNSFKYSSSYSSGTLSDSDLRTINENGDVALSSSNSHSSSFEKYADSKNSLLEVLRSDGNNYGLHFMDAVISTDNILEATNVSILGTKYQNTTYQLPVNSIDFNLKEKGIVNFFAGTYFTNNVTTFFSLHQIFRNSDTTINDIKEIKEIYGNKSKKNWSYIYKFKDGTYYKPYRFDSYYHMYELTADDTGTTPYQEEFLNSIEQYTNSTYNYTKLFDTDWITNYNGQGNAIYSLKQNYIYYFEIPMNKGEFCLGSVSGGTGGYLLYLDIAANASKTQRTIFTEKFQTLKDSFECPLGVAIIEVDSIENSTFSNLDSIFIQVKAGYQGVLSIERDTSNGITVDRTSNTTAVPTYIGDTIQSVVDPGGNNIKNELVVQRETTITKRMQYYDYNVNLGELTKTIITDISVNNINSPRVIKQYANDGSEITNYKIYNTNTGVRLTDNDIASLSISPVSNSVICSLYYVTNEDSSVDKTIVLNASINANITTGTYYKFDNYEVTYEVTGNTLIIKVINLDNQTIYVNEVLLTGTTQTVTVTVS